MNNHYISDPLKDAQFNLERFEAGVNALPQWEKLEVESTIESLRRLILRYGSSAELAIVGMSLQIAVQQKEKLEKLSNEP